MTLSAFPSLWIPLPPLATLPFAGSATGVIDATGEKVHLVGRVWNKDRATKNITKVGFRFSTVVKAGGSGLTVSLQDVDLVNGPPFRGDGTQDQTVAIANGNASFATATWIQTAALSGLRTVAFGESMAVVIEYDGGGRLGADSVIVAAVTTASLAYMTAGLVLETGGPTFTIQSSLANVILEFDDGTFGTLEGAFPWSAIAATAFNSGTTPDERAIEFTVPVSCKVDGGWFAYSLAANADVDFVLYSGTTVLATVSQDYNAQAGASARIAPVTFPEVQLDPGTTYRWACKPTTTNSVTLMEFDVSAANHLQALPGGTSWVHNTRTDGGAWGTATATRRPLGGLRLSMSADNTYPASRLQLGH